MQPIIDVSGKEVRVNVDGPDALTRPAWWIKEHRPCVEHLSRIAQIFAPLANCILEISASVASIFAALAQLCYYCSEGYEVVMAGYISVSAELGVSGTARLSSE